MEGETASFERAAEQREPQKREQSTISFPYHDLDAAAEVGNAVYSRVGYGSCELDELAAEMDQVISGAFRVKLAAAKTFGIVEKDGRSAVKLTDLGKKIVNDAGDIGARVAAFFSVPLYEAIYEQYKGQKLPPMKALERAMLELGVSSKQTDKARQAFERSAEQAGFFDAGKDRLVKPRIDVSASIKGAGDEVAADSDKGKEEKVTPDRRKSGGGGDGGRYHPLIQGMLETLPDVGEAWPEAERKAWLTMAESIFAMIYAKASEVRRPSPGDDIDDLLG